MAVALLPGGRGGAVPLEATRALLRGGWRGQATPYFVDGAHPGWPGRPRPPGVFGSHQAEQAPNGSGIEPVGEFHQGHEERREATATCRGVGRSPKPRGSRSAAWKKADQGTRPHAQAKLYVSRASTPFFPGPYGAATRSACTGWQSLSCEYPQRGSSVGPIAIDKPRPERCRPTALHLDRIVTQPI